VVIKFFLNQLNIIILLIRKYMYQCIIMSEEGKKEKRESRVVTKMRG